MRHNGRPLTSESQGPFFMKKRSLLCLSLCLSSLVLAQQPKAHHTLAEDTLLLRDGWALQSSCKVEQKGDVVSTARFRPQGWHAVSVPTTVFAALVKHKVYADPDFGMNLRFAPGVTYPVGANFSNLPMQPDSPYIVPWWYRKEFVIPASYRGKTLWLNFHGINYKANIWLNGKQIANSDVAAGESKDVTFAPEQFSQLNISSPRLWWPAQMGKPELYKLDMEFVVAGKISDKSEANFGIREVTSQVLAANRRLFSINGKNILIRGGGWSPDMMLRENSQRLEDEFRYVQDMGLNTIRLEGKLETKEFFDLADRKGVLIMAGWCCCDHWEHWAKWKPEDFKIAEQSLRDQMYGMRTHPSLVMWLNGSDNPPPPDVEQTYLKVEKELLWPNPVVSSATAKLAGYSGESGVKMTGPYEYIAPGYWEEDRTTDDSPHKCNPGGCGGAYGFNTETSMGPAVTTIESMGAMLPTDR